MMIDDRRERLRHAVLGQLESLARTGVLDLPKPHEGECRPAPRQPTSVQAPDAMPAPAPQQAAPVKAAESPAKETVSVPKSTGWTASSGGSLFETANSLAQDRSTAPTLVVLQQEVVLCTQCRELASSRTQTVFGVGNPRARLCFLGEAPGADEDRLGEPFVGRAGQLLDRIIAACKMKREDVYICNILKCRPPGNRNPAPDEAASCRRFLDRQLELVAPEFICCLGAVAAQNLLGTQLSIGRLRGKMHAYRGAKVVCTYHPAYLLRNPAAKKDTWEDMQFLMREMGVEL